MVDQGDSTNAPATDIGFDPKCITKGKPTDIAVPSWTVYSIDYTYIKGLGGVAKCWKPGARPAGTKVDIGAYELNATPITGTGGFPVTGTVGGGGSTSTAAGTGGATGAGGASDTGGQTTTKSSTPAGCACDVGGQSSGGMTFLLALGALLALRGGRFIRGRDRR